MSRKEGLARQYNRDDVCDFEKNGYKWDNCGKWDNCNRPKKGKNSYVAQLSSVETLKDGPDAVLVVLDILSLSLVDLVVSIPEAIVKRLEHLLDVARKHLTDLALHICKTCAATPDRQRPS